MRWMAVGVGTWWSPSWQTGSLGTCCWPRVGPEPLHVPSGHFIQIGVQLALALLYLVLLYVRMEECVNNMVRPI